MAYPTFFEFGKSLNNNIGNINDPANPLTYAIMPNYNTQFNHGPTANYFRTYSKQSAIYMKELANGYHGANENWNTYCKAYYDVNTETRINLGTLNSLAFSTINSLSTPKNTVGQNLLRNALELYCIYYPNATFKQEQFDPNIANSPIIHVPHPLCGNCPAIIKFPKDPDNDKIINAVLQNPAVCTDVLCYIWAALFNPKNIYKIRLANSNLTPQQTNSKLYNYLKNQTNYFKKYFNIIMKALGDPCNCEKSHIQCAYSFTR